MINEFFSLVSRFRMFSSSFRRIFCSSFQLRSFSQSIIRNFPRVQQKDSFALTNVVFNDYQVAKPKLIDVQKGLNEYLKDSDAKSLTMIVESKFRLFDVENISTFVQRLNELKIRRDSKENFHQRLFDFVDYFGESKNETFDEEFFFLFCFSS